MGAGKSKKWIWIKLGGVALVAVAIVWAIQKIDFVQVQKDLRSADLIDILLALVALVGFWLCRGTLLYAILRIRGKVSWGLSMVATLIGAMMDQVIPARGGYVVRWGILSLKSRESKSFIFSALLTSTLVEGTTLIFYFLASLCFSEQSLIPRKVVVLMSCGVFVLFVFVLSSKHLKQWIPQTLLLKLPPLVAVLEVFEKARKPRFLIPWYLSSAFAWMFEILILLLCARAVGLSFGFFECLLLLMSINLAILVPVIPGNIGTMHAAITAVLATLNYPKEQALAFAIIFHAVHLIPILAAGGILSLLFPVRTKENQDLSIVQEKSV